MNEHEISEVMQEYRDRLGSCSSDRITTKKPLLTWQRGSLAAAMFGLAVVAAILFMPRYAAAQAADRVGKAIKNVEMRVESQLFRNGKWQLVSRTYVKSGQYRLEAMLGTTLQRTIIVSGDRVLTDHERLPHATSEPAKHSFYELRQVLDMPVLEFVTEAMINFGEVSSDRELTLESGPMINNQPTYKLILTRSNGYRAEVVVDKASNLPITSSYELNGGSEKSVQTYTFNQGLDPALFSFKVGKPVIEIDKEQEALGRAWDPPLATVGATHIRDVSMTDDGTVWVVVSSDLFDATNPMPVQVESSVQDSYVRYERDIDVSAVWGKTRAKINGEDVFVVGFVSADPTRSLPMKIKLAMAPRSQLTPNHSGDGPQSTAKHLNFSFAPRREPGSFPGFFVALDLDHFCFQLAPQIHHLRGKHLAEKKQWVMAGKSYEAAAKAYESFIRRLGTKELKEAIRCYEAARQFHLRDRAQTWHDQLWRETRQS